MHLDWGPLPGSYGWVFPKGDRLTVGVITAKGDPGPTRAYLADLVRQLGLDGLEVPLRVAVMGCVVNGPGEAREADLGVASGNGKGQIFVKGEVIKTVPESKIVETLIEEAMRIAEGMEAVDGAGVEVTAG